MVGIVDSSYKKKTSAAKFPKTERPKKRILHFICWF